MSTPAGLDPVSYIAGIRAALEAVRTEPRPHPGGDSIGHTRSADLRAIYDLIDPLPTARSLHSAWEYEQGIADNARARGAKHERAYPLQARLEYLTTYLDKHGLTGTELDPRVRKAEELMK